MPAQGWGFPPPTAMSMTPNYFQRKQNENRTKTEQLIFDISCSVARL